MNKWYRITCLIALAFFSKSVFSRIDLSDSLTSAFGQGCQSQGTYTKRALGHTANLKKIIKSIQKDSTCLDWANSLDGILEQGSGLYYPSAPQSLDKLENEISELTLMLEQEANPIIAQSLAQELASKKIESINLGTYYKDSLWKSRVHSLSQFNQLAYGLNQSLKSSPHCFNKYPALALQMGGHILGSAGLFDVQKTLVGTGLMGLGTLTQFMIDLIQGLKFQKTLKKLERSALAESITCSLETLSKSYCHARDTQKIITEVAQNRVNPFDKNWIGLTLLKNLGLYNSWISHVTAGSPAGNLIHAFRKKMVIELRSKYEKSREDINAHIKEAQDEIKNSPASQKEAILKRLIKSLVWNIAPKKDNLKSSPYVNSFPENYNCGPLFFYYSPQGERNPTLPPMTNCENYIRSLKLQTPDLQTISLKSEQLLLEGQQYVDIRFSLVKEVDPETVLFEGEQEGKHKKLSPVGTLRTAFHYLQDLSYKYREETPPNTQYIISQTAHIIDQALKIYDRPYGSTYNPPVSKELASKKLESIQKLLAPEMKTSYLEERIKNIVRFEIRKKIENDEIPPMVKELVLLSWNDEIRDLEEYGNMDLENKLHDVQSSQRISISNLEALGIIFNKSLKKVLEQLVDDEKKYGSEPSISATISKLCVLSLTLPQLDDWSPRWKRHFIHRHCKGRELKSIYDPKKLKISFSKLYKSSFSERVCTYYNYMKRNKMYQKLGKPFFQIH